MKKLILLSMLVSMLIFTGCSKSDDIEDSVYEISGVEVYFNDKNYPCKIYQSSEPYRALYAIDNHPSEYFIPFELAIEAIGCDYEKTENGRIIIRKEEDKYTLLEYADKYLAYDSGKGDVVNGATPLPVKEDAFVTTELRIIDDVAYVRVKEIGTLLDCETTYDANCIYIDTKDYYNQSVTMHGTRIGRLRNDKIQINNQPFDIPVYTHSFHPIETIGVNFVNAGELASALGGNVKIKDGNIIEFTAPDSTISEMGAGTVYDSKTDTLTTYNDSDMCSIIDNEAYIPIVGVCTRTNAYVEYYNREGDVPDGAPVKIYTYDFVREDIPATIEELYPYLDTVFSPVVSYVIKEDYESAVFRAKMEWKALMAWETKLPKTPDMRFLKEVPESEDYIAGTISYILKEYSEYLQEKDK